MQTKVPGSFHDSVVDDPLFAAEGMDLDNAAAAIDDIERTFGTLERLYAAGSFVRKLFFLRYPLRKYAAPLSFLRAFVRAERKRRAYIASPSSDTAERLVDAWKDAAREYADNASRYRVFHRLLVRIESDENTFVMRDMFGRLSSYGYVEAFLELLIENGRALTVLAEERAALLTGTGTKRSRPYNAARALPPLKSGEMTPWQAHVHAAEIAGGVSPFRQSDILEKHGPFRYTLPNFDVQPQEHTFMFYRMREKATGRNMMWLALVDTSFFLNLWVSSKEKDDIVRGRYATAVGITPDEIPYWYEPATHLYNTRDLRYWAEIATRIDISRRPELHRNLVSVEKSSTFDLLLGQCSRDMQTMCAHVIRRTRSDTMQSYSALYDLLTRSFPSVYYLPFNGSVWRTPKQPQFLGDGYVGMDPSRRLSDAETRTKLTPDVLEKVMSAQRVREERGRKAGWLP